MDVDRCVMCGEVIPEGRQVCPSCEKAAYNSNSYKRTTQMSFVERLQRFIFIHDLVRDQKKNFIK